jgi:hypothetical protein
MERDVPLDELFDDLYYCIEPHSTFISRGPGDTSLYFAPQMAIEALTWICTSIALPILLDVGKSLIVEHLKKPEDSPLTKMKVAMDLQQAEIDALRKQIGTLLERSTEAPRPTPEAIALARAALSKAVQQNGFPSDVAESDANNAIGLLVKRLWGEERV